MPLRTYKHLISGEKRRTLKELPPSEWEVVLEAPHAKMMEPAGKTGRSKVKGLKEILTKRSREYARDFDAAEQITISQLNGLGDTAIKNLGNSQGLRRKKIDDL